MKLSHWLGPRPLSVCCCIVACLGLEGSEPASAGRTNFDISQSNAAAETLTAARPAEPDVAVPATVTNFVTLTNTLTHLNTVNLAETDPTRYSWRAVLIAALTLGALVFFFAKMVSWLGRIRRSHLFFNRFRDSIESDEYNRLDGAIQQRILSGHYFRAVVFEAESNLAGSGTARSPLARPELDAELRKEKPWLQEDVEEFLFPAMLEGSSVKGTTYRRQWLRDPWGSRTAGLGASAPVAAPQSESEGERFIREREEMLNRKEQEWMSTVQDWMRQVRRQSDLEVNKERQTARKLAKEIAEKAVSIDPDAILGRSPGLMLEFTAVIVIIFAAVILGTLGILKEQQIGTLLAAIAGYVLGRAAATGAAQAESKGPVPSARPPSGEATTQVKS